MLCVLPLWGQGIERHCGLLVTHGHAILSLLLWFECHVLVSVRYLWKYAFVRRIHHLLIHHSAVRFLLTS